MRKVFVVSKLQASISTHESREIEEPRTRVVISLLLLLSFSIFFALYKSNSAFGSDEVWSVKAVSVDYSSTMETLKADVHPPLYYPFL